MKKSTATLVAFIILAFPTYSFAEFSRNEGPLHAHYQDIKVHRAGAGSHIVYTNTSEKDLACIVVYNDGKSSAIFLLSPGKKAAFDNTNDSRKLASTGCYQYPGNYQSYNGNTFKTWADYEKKVVEKRDHEVRSACKGCGERQGNLAFSRQADVDFKIFDQTVGRFHRLNNYGSTPLICRYTTMKMNMRIQNVIILMANTQMYLSEYANERGEVSLLIKCDKLDPSHSYTFDSLLRTAPSL